ncbi:unnamed protein product, partial [Rotaria sordida]
MCFIVISYQSDVTYCFYLFDSYSLHLLLAEILIEFELINGSISVDNQNEERAAIYKFKQRLDRFGKIAPEAKKISRALCFGTSHEAIDSTLKTQL